MFEQMSRFVTRFRDLEQREFVQTHEEERRWNELKEKLSTTQLDEPQQPYSRRCIAVTSLYSQAGSSFVAANAACTWASRGTPVTLCELPGTPSYFYFALDYERRANQQAGFSTTPQLLLQDRLLRIQIDPPLHEKQHFQLDIADWLLRASKDSSFVIIDVSSRWNEAGAQRIFELADEIWIVFDTDLARLTRLFLMEKPPQWWFLQKQKRRLIANKWNHLLTRSQTKKRVEGTLSLWEEHDSTAVYIDAALPLLDPEKIALAHVKANLLAELFPEETEHFQRLVHSCKGRVL
jgi:hypothetical protein